MARPRRAGGGVALRGHRRPARLPVRRRVGIEIDRTSPDSPKGVQVIAEIPDLFGPGFTAQMTYYETKGGAKVFAAGAFTLAAGGHINLYQLFVERSLGLTRHGGRIGMVLPWGLMTDDGSAALRAALFDGMDDWNREHHTKSGLWAKVVSSQITLAEAEKETMTFLKKHLGPREAPLAGNSVWQDRRFLARYMK